MIREFKDMKKRMESANLWVADENFSVRWEEKFDVKDGEEGFLLALK